MWVLFYLINRRKNYIIRNRFMKNFFQKTILIIILFSLLPTFVIADSLGQVENFFVDSNYDNEDRKKISAELINIYPKITSFYGSEWKPGIDDDKRITILFHRMNEEAGGYFRSNDEYEKIRIP